MKYSVQGRAYNSKAELIRDFEERKQKYLNKDCRFVHKWNDKDSAWLLALFRKYHPNKPKFAQPIQYCYQRLKYPHIRGNDQVEILIRYDDGEDKVVGMSKFFGNLGKDPERIARNNFVRACRNAVKEDLANWRAIQFEVEQYYRGHRLENDRTTHVDHCGEYEFRDIVSEFQGILDQHGGWQNVEVGDDQCFVDEAIADAFRELHDHLAELQLLPAEENLAKNHW